MDTLKLFVDEFIILFVKRIFYKYTETIILKFTLKRLMRKMIFTWMGAYFFLGKA